MKNIMKEMLVSGLQAKVDNETFIKRVAYLLNENVLELLCTGIPSEILDYDLVKLKDIMKRYDSNVLEVKNVYLTSDPESPVCVEYTVSVVKYFASQEDAEKAAKDENRYAGDREPSESKPVSHAICYTNKMHLTIDQANKCCVFSRI